jgi:cbb3-type cytochrome oxidase subunit 3
MSVDLSGEITAIATAVLAVFAIVTAAFAVLAFRKQSKEVSDQALMLELQSEQLAEQRKVNAEQIRVLGLQAAELRESLAERKREAAERRRAQASRIFISAEPSPEGSVPIDSFLVHIVNTSQQPIYHLIFFWRDGTGEWNEPPGPPGHPVLILQPDFVTFMFGGLVAGSGRFWRDAGGAAARRTIAAGAGCLSLA